MSQIGDTYYSYDGNGNVISARQGSPASSPANALVEEENGIYSTDYGFAMYGRETSERPASQTDYTWNERNLMTSSVNSQYDVHYQYGADGQRAGKYEVRSSSQTLYFNNNLFVTLTSGDGWIENKHIFLGNTRIITKRRESTNTNYSQEYKQQYYYHGDHLGNVQLVTNNEGKIHERFEYTPYGELWIDDKHSTETTPYRFTGKEQDEETGLIYFGARYLNPQTSMWLSADPAMGEYVPGAPINDEVRKSNQNLPGMGGVFNAVNLHTYHYAGNNPVKYIDPDGNDFRTSEYHTNTKRYALSSDKAMHLKDVLNDSFSAPGQMGLVDVSELALSVVPVPTLISGILGILDFSRKMDTQNNKITLQNIKNRFNDEGISQKLESGEYTFIVTERETSSITHAWWGQDFVQIKSEYEFAIIDSQTGEVQYNMGTWKGKIINLDQIGRRIPHATLERALNE
jgi:RHS repeat-associated protein